MILRPYQEVGRDFLARRRHALLADEMRVGKTPQAILAAEKVGARNILVVCPAIAVPHWNREFDAWWPGHPPVTVVSYDYSRGHRAELTRNVWDVVIVDEAHFAKNPEAQRTKLIYGKGGLGWASKRLWALSGTPAPKHAGELWPMLRAFGVVGMRYSEFIDRYCTVDSFTGRVTGTKVGAVPELREFLKKIMLRRTRKEVAPDMPAISFSFLEVDAEGADVSAPENMSDEDLEAWMEWNVVTGNERIDVALSKVDALVEEIVFTIDHGLLKQAVVFGWHRLAVEALAHQLKARDITLGVITGRTGAAARASVQEAFRRHEIQVVVANILAAGTAIDLSAASHGYFLELDWVPGNNLQAANRLVSMDKREPVTIDVVTRPGSMDDRIQKVLLRRVRELGKLY